MWMIPTQNNTVRRGNGGLKVTIYRKPTHTDQYLSFGSNHPLDQKLSVVSTLQHRAQTVVTDEDDRKKEIAHVTGALAKCGYPDWAIEKATKPPKEKKKPPEKQKNTRKGPPVALPYIKGVTEEVRRIMKSYGCNSYIKPNNTLRQLLCKPKDPNKKEETAGVIYRIDCGGNKDEECDSFYVGETGRTLKARASEHRRPSTKSSEVSQHLHAKDRAPHEVTIEDNVRISENHGQVVKGANLLLPYVDKKMSI